jgi:hypothetical protein
MKLVDLMPLAIYNEQQNLSTRESLATALAGKIEIFYVFEARNLVVYEPIDESHHGKGTKNNMFGGPEAIELDIAPCDFIPVPPNVLRDLWAGMSDENSGVFLEWLIAESTPEGFGLTQMLSGRGREVTIDDLYVKKDASAGKSELEVAAGDKDKLNNTALKVIGLLMHQLAKSPKYASRSGPNKSQIKELLLTLAEDLKVSPYGLSKVDERLLTDAMKYLEDQKS